MVNLKRLWIRLDILKRRDPVEYRRTPFIEENRVRWETFHHHLTLKKSKLRLLTADGKVCNS
jgi:hypothetical protein